MPPPPSPPCGRKETRWLGYVAPTTDASELTPGALGITSLSTTDRIRSCAPLLVLTIAFMLLAGDKPQGRET